MGRIIHVGHHTPLLVGTYTGLNRSLSLSLSLSLPLSLTPSAPLTPAADFLPAGRAENHLSARAHLETGRSFVTAPGSHLYLRGGDTGSSPVHFGLGSLLQAHDIGILAKTLDMSSVPPFISLLV